MFGPFPPERCSPRTYPVPRRRLRRRLLRLRRSERASWTASEPASQRASEPGGPSTPREGPRAIKHKRMGVGRAAAVRILSRSIVPPDRRLLRNRHRALHPGVPWSGRRAPLERRRRHSRAPRRRSCHPAPQSAPPRASPQRAVPPLRRRLRGSRCRQGRGKSCQSLFLLSFLELDKAVSPKRSTATRAGPEAGEPSRVGEPSRPWPNTVASARSPPPPKPVPFGGRNLRSTPQRTAAGRAEAEWDAGAWDAGAGAGRPLKRLRITGEAGATHRGRQMG